MLSTTHGVASALFCGLFNCFCIAAYAMSDTETLNGEGFPKNGLRLSPLVRGQFEIMFCSAPGWGFWCFATYEFQAFTRNRAFALKSNKEGSQIPNYSGVWSQKPY